MTTSIVAQVVEAATAVRVAGHRGAAGPRLPVDDPATGTAFAELATGGPAEAGAALRAARSAAAGWAATPAPDRAAALRAIAETITQVAARGEWPALVTRETGKRLAEARAELDLTAAYFRTNADLLERQQTEHIDAVPGTRHEVTVRPAGIAVVLTPWNFPVSIPGRKLAPAVAAGCPVLFKPSELAPLSSLVLAAICESHLPEGLLSTVLGEPEQVVAPWLADPAVRVVSFTGSTRVGRLVAAQAAPSFLRTVLELGGCAPFVVLPDADPKAAAETLLVAKYRNNGQSCIAANQVFVAAQVAGPFIEAFVAATRAVRVGDPSDPQTGLGPLAPAGDPARIAGIVADAVSRGARAVTTGAVHLEPGHYVTPTVLCDPPADCLAMAGETFGPVAPLYVYRDLAEALRLHHATGYGLAGYVCGTDLEAARAVAAQLRAGIIGINTGTPNTPWVPFGGLGESGLWYEGGAPGLAAFQSLHSVAVRAAGS